MKDIVFFTSPIGLGHATRDVAISQHLGSVSMKFVSGYGAFRMLSECGLEAEDLYHPPHFRIEGGRLQDPLRWLFRYLSFYNESKRISSGVISNEVPRLVVSDEDFGSLATAQKRGLDTVLVTDILETKFASGIGSVVERAMNRGMRDIIARCEIVIIPETGRSEGNIARVGPIVRDASGSREELRKKFSFGRKTVLISTGGTDLGRFLVEKAVEVFSRGKIDAEFVLVSGPSLKMAGLPFRDLGFASNMHEAILASDVVVSLAGKSTIDESVHFGTPGIFIPIKGHFEQEENAAEMGYTHEDVFRLEELILEKMGQRRDPRPFDGARAAAELIRKFL